MKIIVDVNNLGYWEPVFGVLFTKSMAQAKDCHLRRVIEFAIEIFSFSKDTFNSTRADCETLLNLLKKLEKLRDGKTYYNYLWEDTLDKVSYPKEIEFTESSKNYKHEADIDQIFTLASCVGKYNCNVDAINERDFRVILEFISDLIENWDRENPITPVTETLLNGLLGDFRRNLEPDKLDLFVDISNSR